MKVQKTQTVAIDFSMTEPKAMVSHLRRNKIDLYSDTDIESQHSWLEKERMKFWNAKAQALEISKETLSFNKTDLVGAVDVSWTYMKIELLNIKISELDLEHERYRNVFHDLYVRAGGLSKTSDTGLDLSPKVYKYKEEISKYQYLIEQEHKKIKEFKKLRAKDKDVLTDVIDAGNRIHNYLYQLKWLFYILVVISNSDYLFKTLSFWKKRLDTFKSKNIYPSEDLDDGTYKIDSSEITDLAADVLNNDLQDRLV